MVNEIVESINQLDKIIEAIEEGITLSDEKGYFEIYNSKMQEITGYTSEEANSSNNFMDVLYTDLEEHKKTLENINEVVQKGKTNNVETTIQTKNGEKKTLLVSTSTIQYNNSNMFLSVYRDITRRKRAEEKYKKLFDSSRDALMTLTPPDWKFTSGNEATVKLFNAKDEAEFTSKGPWDVSPENQPDGTPSSEKAKKMIGEAMETGSNFFEWTHRTLDGKEFSTTVLLTRVEIEKDNPFLQATVRDITEQKKSEEEVAKAKSELEIKNQRLNTAMQQMHQLTNDAENALTELDQIFNISTDGILVIDKKFRILRINNTFSKMYNINKANALGRRCYEVLNLEICKSDNCPMKKMQADTEHVEYELTLEPDNKTKIPCNFTATHYKKIGGEIIGVVEYFKDISEQKKNEGRIKQQNIKLKKLDQLKSAFLNITSHELRTPMSSIKGYVQMMLKQTLGEITEEQKKSLEVVLRNTNRLDHLIQDILDISRLESGTMKFIPEKTDLKKMMYEIAETMKSSAEVKEIKIHTDVMNNIPGLVIDPDRIKQVVINFMNNAIKFSPDGSIINIRAKKEKDNILFEVQDFGRGIPKDKQKRVFDTFYQVDSGVDRKFGGAGLGLAISRGIVLAHGGDIWVESNTEKGSSFRFTLPVKPVKDLEERFKEVDVFRLEAIS